MNEIPAVEVFSGITRKQQGRLRTFGHLVDLANEQENNLKKGKPLIYGTYKEKVLAEKYMDLDGKFVHTINTMADHMYEFELIHDPVTKAGADFLVTLSRGQYGEDVPTVSELQTIWERD